MKDSPPGEWFCFYHRRFFGSPRVLELTPAQKCLYLRALAQQFESGAIEGSDRALQVAFAGCYDDWKTDWAAVSALFRKGVNSMMAEVREHALSKRQACARAGKIGRQAQLGQTPGQSPGSRSADAGLGEERREEEKKEEEKTPPSPPRGRPQPWDFSSWLSQHPEFDRPRIREGLSDFDEMRLKGPARQAWTDKAKARVLNTALSLGPDDAERALDNAISGGYRTLYHPGKNGTHKRTDADRKMDELVWEEE